LPIFLGCARLIMFGGITDRLIPLFAVGAFLAFTLSQAGMVAHWRRVAEPHTWRNMLVNGVGATATAITLVVVLVEKFAEGARITLLLIPAMLVLFYAVYRHYIGVAHELAYHAPLDLRGLRHPIVIEAQWSLARAVVVLVGATAAVALEAELVSDALEATAGVLRLSPFFMGVIVLPLVGNATEYVTAVYFARQIRWIWSSPSRLARRFRWPYSPRRCWC
jgi:Ca2+/Na+ antiporter